MADRDVDKGSNRGFASMDQETRERIARKGGEASHGNDPGRSSGSRSRSEPGSERGGREGGGREGGRGGSSGGRGGEGQGVWYDEEAGQCRDETGLFDECPPGMEGKGTREDPNKERVASRGGEHSRGGHGRESGGERGGSSGGRD